MRLVLLATVLTAVAGIVAASAPEPTHAVVPPDATGLYWTDFDGVFHADFDGAEAHKVVTGPPMSLYIEVDASAGRMFWAARNVVYSANLDGSDRQTVADGLSFATGVAVDARNAQVYWTDYWAGSIERADYDGSNRELVLAIGTPRGIVVDGARQRLIFTDGSGQIYTATLDGQNLTLLVAGSGHTGQDLALEPASGEIFWADGPTGAGRIWRANGDGTQAQVIAVVDGTPSGVDFDPTTGKVYWVNGGFGAVERANADGTGWERLFSRPEPMWGIAVLPLDTTPPTLTVEANPSMLWPPNHKYVTVQTTVVSTDDSGIAPNVELVSVTSNEPDDGPGDGSTLADIVVGADPYSVELRAERSEYGTGRIYTLTYRATDWSGNSALRSVTVTIPLTQ